MSPIIVNGFPNTEVPKVDWVDLGLSVKWMKKNIGADKITDYGNYYAWGDVEPKSDYSWSTYKWANGAYNKLTKYCPTDKTDYWDGDGAPDNITTLEPEDDVATVTLGEGYRMPTKEECDELIALPNKWTTVNGVSGRMLVKESDVISDPNIEVLSDGFYFYDSNYPEFNDGNSIDLNDELSLDGIKYLSKSEFATYLTTYLSKNYDYEGTVNIDTMIFSDETHETPLVYGTDYSFGILPEFNEGTMLFIPAAGRWGGTSLDNEGTGGCVWYSTLNPTYPDVAMNLFFVSGECDVSSSGRYGGCSARAVIY
jgi:hypothetical protein